MEMVTELPRLPPRAADSNKGNFGRVLVVAGSRGMSGAAVLCGSAALRAGAGLVKIALPESILHIVAPCNPCYMTVPLPEDLEGRLMIEALAEVTSLVRASDIAAIGPGLGRNEDLAELLPKLIQRVETPIVLDADGLNAFAEKPETLKKHKGPLILTPHPGEFARLLGTDTKAVQSGRAELAGRFASEFGVILVLKGQGTIVSDGRRAYRNTTGNPGMATGGTGDVLTGVIAALWGQGLDAFEAAQLGVHVHGRAGDLASAHLGEPGLIATDLLTYLPEALREALGSR